MLSRVANTIYWLSRYIERAENYARLIDVNLNLTLDLPPSMPEQWRPLIKTTGDSHLFEPNYNGKYTKENVVRFMAFDRDNPNSVISCLFQARENARTVREIISSEMWMQINELYLSVKEGISSEDQLGEFFNTVKRGSHLFNGVMNSSFSHQEGWHFAVMGRLLERADKTARILDTKYFYLLPSASHVGTPLDLLQWSALLKSASAYEMYRKKYGDLDLGNILRFLILNRSFPRAIHYCLFEAQRSLHAVTGADFLSFSTPAGKELGKLRSELDYTELSDILDLGLHEYLDSFEMKLNNVNEAIHNTFFALNQDAKILGYAGKS